MKVDCRQVEQALIRGDAVDQGDLAAHLEGCLACQELAAAGPALVRALDSPDPAGADLGPLKAALARRLERERGPLAWLRSRATPVRIVLALAAALVTLVAVLLLTPRADLATYPTGRMALALIPMLAGLAWLANDALRPMHLPPATRLRIGLALGAGLLIPLGLAIMPQAHTAHPASLVGMGEDFWPRAVACFVFGLITGLPVLVIAQLADRGGGWLGRLLLALAVAGLAGNLALQLHCPITHPAHLLAGHASVGVALVLVMAGPLFWLRARKQNQK